MVAFLANKTGSNSGETGRFRTVFRLGRLLDLIADWNKRSRDRQLLEGMGERNLRDIGIDDGPIRRDSAMSFWRLRHGLGPGSATDRRSNERRGG